MLHERVAGVHVAACEAFKALPLLLRAERLGERAGVARKVQRQQQAVGQKVDRGGKHHASLLPHTYAATGSPHYNKEAGSLPLLCYSTFGRGIP